MNIQFCLQHKLLYAVTVDSDNVPRKIHYSTPGSLCPALHPRSQKTTKSVRYSCHICGDTGHKIIDCPKYNDMQQKISVHDTNICALVATWVSYVLDIQLTLISSIFPTSRQRLNASYWCLRWTLSFAGPQSNLHIPRGDPGSKKHISHFTLCCSGGEHQRSFFPFLLDWCIHSLGSKLEIQNQKIDRKKVAAHRHFLRHWLSFLCQGEGNIGRIASIGSIYWAESGKDRVDLLSRIPDLRVVNVFTFFLSKTCSTRKRPKEEEEAEIE